MGIWAWAQGTAVALMELISDWRNSAATPDADWTYYGTENTSTQIYYSSPRSLVITAQGGATPPGAIGFDTEGYAACASASVTWRGQVKTSADTATIAIDQYAGSWSELVSESTAIGDNGAAWHLLDTSGTLGGSATQVRGSIMFNGWPSETVEVGYNWNWNQNGYVTIPTTGTYTITMTCTFPPEVFRQLQMAIYESDGVTDTGLTSTTRSYTGTNSEWWTSQLTTESHTITLTYTGTLTAGNRLFFNVQVSNSPGELGPDSLDIPTYMEVSGQWALNQTVEVTALYINSLPAYGREIQRATLTGFDVDGDSFQIRYAGNDSTTITRGTNYTNADLKSAIEGISGWPAGATVSISNRTNAGFTMTFSPYDFNPSTLDIVDEVNCTGTVAVTMENGWATTTDPVTGAAIAPSSGSPGYLGTYEWYDDAYAYIDDTRLRRSVCGGDVVAGSSNGWQVV